MRKLIDIPEDGRAFKAFAGRNLIAFTDAEGDFLYVTKVPCNRCGECCMKDAPFPDDEGRCTYLIQNGNEFECNAGNMVPYDCVQYDPSDEPYCCIEYTKKRLK